MWTHRTHVERHEPFSIDAALDCTGCDQLPLPVETRREHYAHYLRQAAAWAERLGEPARRDDALDAEFGELQFFNVG